ncbi:conserved hypothetical protein [Ricinus communis]|uniref:Retrotransposon gag domain-containing protein n=1 Tax=Ricinus communis TaxID=3988 RepID=B9RHK8_RICCO|nr:conserved hypothetical protein [Ricinus communis]
MKSITKIPRRRMILELCCCQQGENETLRSYLKRFKIEAIQIEDINVETMAMALKEGMRFEKLIEKLRKKILVPFSKLMALSRKYVDVDEGRRNDRKREQEKRAKK